MDEPGGGFNFLQLVATALAINLSIFKKGDLFALPSQGRCLSLGTCRAATQKSLSLSLLPLSFSL